MLEKPMQNERERNGTGETKIDKRRVMTGSKTLALVQVYLV